MDRRNLDVIIGWYNRKVLGNLVISAASSEYIPIDDDTVDSAIAAMANIHVEEPVDIDGNDVSIPTPTADHSLLVSTPMPNAELFAPTSGTSSVPVIVEDDVTNPEDALEDNPAPPNQPVPPSCPRPRPRPRIARGAVSNAQPAAGAAGPEPALPGPVPRRGRKKGVSKTRGA